jgi:hypothetical protein
MSGAVPSPTPSWSPAANLFINGLSASSLWHLLWPALVGVGLLGAGVVLVVGYGRQLFMGVWPPHWSRAAFGLTLVVGSLPAFLGSAARLESEAAALGIPVVSLLVAIALQLGLFESEGGRRRR